MNRTNNDQGQVLPDLLTVEQVAERLQLGRNHTYALTRSGRIPSIRFGRAWRIPRAGLEKFINEIGISAVQGKG